MRECLVSAFPIWLDAWMVSALKDDGMELLKDLIVGYLPEGPEYFPKDMITDCTETFLLEEIIREKVLHLTRFEVPHSVAVIVENMQGKPFALHQAFKIAQGEYNNSNCSHI